MIDLLARLKRIWSFKLTIRSGFFILLITGLILLILTMTSQKWGIPWGFSALKEWSGVFSNLFTPILSFSAFLSGIYLVNKQLNEGKIQKNIERYRNDYKSAILEMDRYLQTNIKEHLNSDTAFEKITKKVADNLTVSEMLDWLLVLKFSSNSNERLIYKEAGGDVFVPEKLMKGYYLLIEVVHCLVQYQHANGMLEFGFLKEKKTLKTLFDKFVSNNCPGDTPVYNYLNDRNYDLPWLADYTLTLAMPQYKDYRQFR